jgi:hypothetical protein
MNVDFCYKNIKIDITNRNLFNFEVKIYSFEDNCFFTKFDNCITYTFDKIIVGKNYPDDLYEYIQNNFTDDITGIADKLNICQGSEELFLILLTCYIGFVNLLNDDRFVSGLPFIPNCVFNCLEEYVYYDIMKYYQDYTNICLSLIEINQELYCDYKYILQLVNLFCIYFKDFFNHCSCDCSLDVPLLVKILTDKIICQNQQICELISSNESLKSDICNINNVLDEIIRSIKCQRVQKY